MFEKENINFKLVLTHIEEIYEDIEEISEEEYMDKNLELFDLKSTNGIFEFLLTNFTNHNYLRGNFLTAKALNISIIMNQKKIHNCTIGGYFLDSLVGFNLLAKELWFSKIFSSSIFIRLNQNDNVSLSLMKFEDFEHNADGAIFEIYSYSYCRLNID